MERSPFQRAGVERSPLQLAEEEEHRRLVAGVVELHSVVAVVVVGLARQSIWRRKSVKHGLKPISKRRN